MDDRSASLLERMRAAYPAVAPAHEPFWLT
jgi:hypothetical protein